MRQHTKDTLDHYAEHGIPTGGFLEAVLCNDLMQAMGRADLHSRAELFEICDYVYNNLPKPCWGSAEIVKAWVERHAQMRINLRERVERLKELKTEVEGG